MKTINRMTHEDRKRFTDKIGAMSDGDLEAELHKTHVELAHVRQTLAEMVTAPEPEMVEAGAVGFADAGAVVDFLEEHRAPVIRDERRRVALVMEKNLVSCAGMISTEHRSRLRRQAYRNRAQIILDGADALRAAAAVIQAQATACQRGGVPAVLSGLPGSIEQEIKQAERFFR